MSVRPVIEASRAGVLPHGAREAAVEVGDPPAVVVEAAAVAVVAGVVVDAAEKWVQKHKD